MAQPSSITLADHLMTPPITTDLKLPRFELGAGRARAIEIGFASFGELWGFKVENPLSSVMGLSLLAAGLNRAGD
jgi:hypothetical protein